MKTIKFILFSYLILLTIACISKKNQKIDTCKLNITKPQYKDSSEVPTFVKNTIDTSSYKNLPYFNTNMDHYGRYGYIDTFTIHDSKFRIIHTDTSYVCLVEKFNNGIWYTNMEDILSKHNDYDISKDFDGDGYKDYIHYWRSYGEIHFFDTTKNEFCYTVNCTIGVEWTLLDTANHIYFENDFEHLTELPINSNLFTLKNATRLDIATLNIYYNPDKSYVFTRGSLFKNNDKKPIEKVIPNEDVMVRDFDYKAFWKKRYKRLIGIH